MCGYYFRRDGGGDAVICERWSKRAGTLPRVNAMLAEISSDLAAAEVTGPQVEDLLMIWNPPAPDSSFPRGDYEVAREQDWIVRAGSGSRSVFAMSGHDFNDEYEPVG